MKSFILLLIILLSSLILKYLFSSRIKESLENTPCSEDQKNQNNLVYKNSGIIEQQQKDIKDFETSIKEKITALITNIQSFQPIININRSAIAYNRETLKDVIKEIKSGGEAMDKKLNALGGDLPST